MKQILSVLSVLWMAFSCVYPYETPELSEEANQYLVVDGSIIVGKYASLSVHHMNETGKLLPDDWWVEDNTGVQYRPAHVSENVDLSKAPSDRSYRMVIKSEGKTYSSSLERGLDQPVIQDVSFESIENEVYVNVSLSDGAEGTGFVALSYEEIYKFHTQFVHKFDVDPEIWAAVKLPQPDSSLYYCWRYLKPTQETLVDMTHLGGIAKDYPVTFFPRGSEKNHGDYTIKVSARSVSDAEYRFQKNIENVSGRGNNLFTPNPGEIAGNVRCEEDVTVPVFGYVTLSLASTMEAHLDGRYYLPVDADKSGFLDLKQEEIPHYFLHLQYWPLFEEKNDNMSTTIFWGPKRCIDCVADGGSLNKPVFR